MTVQADDAPAAERQRRGLVIVNTGEGKGKTTAALGLALRAWGRGMRVCVLQFLKNAHARTGEIRAAEKLGVEWIGTGNGPTWGSAGPEDAAARARVGWELAQARIVSGEYDLIVLDEFTYLLHYGWLDTSETVAWLRTHRPPMLHLVITGRAAPQALIDYADLVTEMSVVKHPYADQGLRAQPGIEY